MTTILCPSCHEPRPGVVGPEPMGCEACGAQIYLPRPGGDVVVGFPSAAGAQAVADIVLRVGTRPVHLTTGSAVIRAAERRGIRGYILDVAISEPTVFEVVSRLRDRIGMGIPIILVSSVYDKAAYKRRPTSLYGADDYVEQHHVPDFLLEKLTRWIGPVTVPVSASVAEELKHRLHEAARSAAAGGAPSVAELAQRISADIVLYVGLSTSRPVALRDALVEGRRLLHEVCGDTLLPSGEDAMTVAFRDLLAGVRGA